MSDEIDRICKWPAGAARENSCAYPTCGCGKEEVDDREYLRHTNAMLVRKVSDLEEEIRGCRNALLTIIKMDRRSHGERYECDGPYGEVARKGLGPKTVYDDD